jgi:hypothetical protein
MDSAFGKEHMIQGMVQGMVHIAMVAIKVMCSAGNSNNYNCTMHCWNISAPSPSTTTGSRRLDDGCSHERLDEVWLVHGWRWLCWYGDYVETQLIRLQWNACNFVKQTHTLHLVFLMAHAQCIFLQTDTEFLYEIRGLAPTEVTHLIMVQYVCAVWCQDARTWCRLLHHGDWSGRVNIPHELGLAGMLANPRASQDRW